MTPSSPATAAPARPDHPHPSELARHWRLDPNVVFLNHGSFGACPAEVLDAQSRHRARIEAEPIRFFVEDLEAVMDGVRRELGAFLHCPPESLALLTNATVAVSTVLRNTRLRPGDEVLFTDHEYPACRHAFEHAADQAGAKVVTAPLPFPVAHEGEIVEAVLAAVTGRTRLVLISHMTSPSAMVLPVEEIVAELNRRGVESLVDGAHAPGCIPLDIGRLGATYYTANCHKWICSPKGTAFLHVREDRRRRGFRPLALSNSAKDRRPDRDHFLVEFDYVGTDDLSDYMTIPDAIRVMGAMVPGGWPEVMRRNRDLALKARRLLLDVLGTEPAAPERMLGPLATMFFPASHPTPPLQTGPGRYRDPLQERLVKHHGIQVPLWTAPTSGRRTIRISAQLYNSFEQYERLAAALREELR